MRRIQTVVQVAVVFLMLCGSAWGEVGYIPLSDKGPGICIDERGYLYVCKDKEEKPPCDCDDLKERVEALEKAINRLRNALSGRDMWDFKSGVTYSFGYAPSKELWRE